jgi:putative endonuclease
MAYVYILKCSDGSYYPGFTTDIERRLAEHNQGIGSKYTRSRLPVECVYQEELSSKSEAMKRESAIKKMSHNEKEKLVNDNREF